MSNAAVSNAARSARRLGWTARQLAGLTDREWEAMRVALGCEDASTSELADIVDRVLLLEQNVDNDDGRR